jgi:transposase
MKRIKLGDKEVEYLEAFVRRGRKSARELTRARILLLVNEGRTENEIKDILGICRATVSNIKKRYREEGLQIALTEKPRPGQPKKYTEEHEAEIIALACTSPPEGRKRWSVRLLMHEARKRLGFKTINHESIRLILKKARLSLG